VQQWWITSLLTSNAIWQVLFPIVGVLAHCVLENNLAIVLVGVGGLTRLCGFQAESAPNEQDHIVLVCTGDTLSIPRPSPASRLRGLSLPVSRESWQEGQAVLTSSAAVFGRTVCLQVPWDAVR